MVLPTPPFWFADCDDLSPRFRSISWTRCSTWNCMNQMFHVEPMPRDFAPSASFSPSVAQNSDIRRELEISGHRLGRRPLRPSNRIASAILRQRSGRTRTFAKLRSGLAEENSLSLVRLYQSRHCTIRADKSLPEYPETRHRTRCRRFAGHLREDCVAKIERLAVVITNGVVTCS